MDVKCSWEEGEERKEGRSGMTQRGRTEGIKNDQTNERNGLCCALSRCFLSWMKGRQQKRKEGEEKKSLFVFVEGNVPSPCTLLFAFVKARLFFLSLPSFSLSALHPLVLTLVDMCLPVLLFVPLSLSSLPLSLFVAFLQQSLCMFVPSSPRSSPKGLACPLRVHDPATWRNYFSSPPRTGHAVRLWSEL